MFDLDIAFLIALGLVVLGRLLTRRAFRALNPEDRARLVDAFARRRGVGLVLLFALVAAYILCSRRWPEAMELLTVIFVVLLVALFGVASLSTWRQIASLELPLGYVRQYLGAQALSAVAIVVLVLAIFA